jgi:hypothetical protein
MRRAQQAIRQTIDDVLQWVDSDESCDTLMKVASTTLVVAVGVLVYGLCTGQL